MKGSESPRSTESGEPAHPVTKCEKNVGPQLSPEYQIHLSVHALSGSEMREQPIHELYAECWLMIFRDSLQLSNDGKFIDPIDRSTFTAAGLGGKACKFESLHG